MLGHFALHGGKGASSITEEHVHRSGCQGCCVGELRVCVVCCCGAVVVVIASRQASMSVAVMLRRGCRRSMRYGPADSLSSETSIWLVVSNAFVLSLL